MATATFDKTGRSLVGILEKAAKFDSWGQRLEAAEAYQKFCKEAEQSPAISVDEGDQKVLAHIVTRAKQRAELLQQPAVIGSIDSDDLSYYKQVEADVEELSEILRKLKKKRSLQRRLSEAVLKEIKEGGLLPSLSPKKEGFTYLTVKVDKIGLKDAMTYAEPFITVALRDGQGADLTPTQSTPPAELYEEKHIIFSEDVHIQKTMEEIEENSIIVFEFKHFKARKNKISVKCFALLEKEDITNGPMALELYQKPVEYNRKKLRLLTEKQLYLHIFLNLRKI